MHDSQIRTSQRQNVKLDETMSEVEATFCNAATENPNVIAFTPRASLTPALNQA